MNNHDLSPQAIRWIRRWLILMGLMVYAMILIGGATRLTDSGLSITEWEPIKGALPPMGDAAWREAFANYRETAEYRLQNSAMTLAEFQYIFWWEWSHRLFGRLIGLVAVLGFAVFALRKWLTRALSARLLILIALGGLQGLIGWWMVSSGIGETSRVDVAPYRLMTHFMLAMGILGYIIWLWLDLGRRERLRVGTWARRIALVLCALIFVQMAAGALVAGLDAGRTYTDWPLMAGEFIPRHYIENGLGLRSLFEGRAATQFNHRMLAYLLWGVSLLAAWRMRMNESRKAFFWLAGLVSAQAVWGIVTLLNAAPLPFALVHQALGVATALAAVRLVWLTRQVPEHLTPP